MEQENKWIKDILRHGSRPAANKLIRAHYNEIYVFVYRQIGNKEDAMDLTQGIFLAVLHSLPSLDARKASFRTWLYRIAANKVIDARRRPHSNVVPLENAELPDSDDFTARVRDRVLLDGVCCAESDAAGPGDRAGPEAFLQKGCAVKCGCFSKS